MIDIDDVKDYLDDKADDMKERLGDWGEKKKEETLEFKNDAFTHLKYNLFSFLSSPLKFLTLLRFLKIYYYHVKYFKDDGEKIDRVCEYLKDSVHISQEPLPYPVSVITGQMTEEQLAYLTYIAISHLRIRTKLVAGTYNKTTYTLGEHTWCECLVHGRMRYVDVLNYTGIVPVEEEKRYETDKKRTVYLNLYFNKTLVLGE